MNDTPKPTLAGALYFAHRRAHLVLVLDWQAGQTIIAGQERRNADNLYVATNSGTTGATAPTVLAGTQSDGVVTWSFSGALPAKWK